MLERIKLYLLNLHFFVWFFFLSGTVIPALTLTVVCLRPFSSYRATMRRFRRSISWYGKIVMAIPFPFIKVRYEDDKQDDPDKPYIFVCNHRSATDAFLIGILPHELVQIVNMWPFKLPVLGPYARFSGYLNIRIMPPDQFREKALQLLQEGVSIVFFPEGTRSMTGTMGAFHGAAFRLAIESHVPIVPLCISGSEQVMPKGASLLRPGTIRVRRLPAIPWDAYQGLTAFAFKNRVWKIMDEELSRMENNA
jgi:1-acyl-sn-glycerol-3-phosphate acyltransferase